MRTVSTVTGSAVGAPTLHLWCVLGISHVQNDAMVELFAFIAFRFILSRLVNLVERMSSFVASTDHRLLYMSYVRDVNSVCCTVFGGFLHQSCLGRILKRIMVWIKISICNLAKQKKILLQ